MLSSVLMATAMAACSGRESAGPEKVASATVPAAAEVQYSDPANWLCRPGKPDTPCLESQDATSVAADGSTKVEPFHPAADPPIDCFYVYPTVSRDSGENSDLVPGDEERSAVAQQAARFASVCRLYVPVYRQITSTALASGRFRDPSIQDLAYRDVLAAWKQYLNADNQGRGFVLLGHSQGALHVLALVRGEIDANPGLRARLVSAIILGWTVRVPVGADRGGDFTDVPACRSPGQLGCVVSYASYAADAPPPADSIFGRTASAGTEALCVNPASLSGGQGELHPYFGQAAGRSLVSGGEDLGPVVDTPYVTYPGLLRAECVRKDGASYLEVTAAPGAADRRPSLRFSTILGPQWGLHIYDFSLSLGNLVTLVASQSAAYQGR